MSCRPRALLGRTFTRIPRWRFIVADEYELDMKRLGEMHHHVQRQLLRVRPEPCGDLAGMWSGVGAGQDL